MPHLFSWKYMDTLAVAPTFSPLKIGRGCTKRELNHLSQTSIFRGKLAVFVEVVFPHFLLSQIFTYVIPLFSICVNWTPLLLREKKSTVPVTLVGLKKIPKVEPCEPSPATAEVASERRNRGPVADAVLSSGQVCVAWLGGIDGLGGVVLGVLVQGSRDFRWNPKQKKGWTCLF